MISKFFIERPVLANVLAILMVVIGRRRAVQPAGRAISRRRAADRAGDDALSGRQRPTVVDRHRGAADRAAGQRRRGHDLHAVLQRRRRHLYADGDVQDRHRPQLRAGAGAEPRVERDCRRCRRRCRAQGVTVQKKSTSILHVRDADLARTRAATTACSSSNYATISLRDELSAPAGRRQRHACSAPGNIRCASGSIRTS